jgi:hypothetical protein
MDGGMTLARARNWEAKERRKISHQQAEEKGGRK